MFELDLSLIVFCGFTIVLFCSVTSISLLHRFFYNKSSIGHANKLDKKRSKSATRTGRLQDEECRTTSSQQSLARRHQEQSKASGAKVTQSCKAEQIEILGPKEPTDADVENPSMGGTMRKIGNMREATASIGNEMIHQLFDGMKKIVDKKQQAKDAKAEARRAAKLGHRHRRAARPFVHLLPRDPVTPPIPFTRSATRESSSGRREHSATGLEPQVEDPQHVQELSQVRGMLQELRQKQKGGDMALEEGSFWSSEFPPRQKSLISTHNEDCPICLIPFHQDKFVVALPCGHAGCRAC
ncbi:hypothetical protein CYMTET_46852, partial [Cymbomonas tetramitiformis]